jgi:hypothetical protein
MGQFSIRLIAISLTCLLMSCGGGSDDTSVEIITEIPQKTSISTGLNWVAPTNRIDSYPLSASEIGGYKVYFGTSANDLNLIATIIDPSTLTYEVTDLSKGTYYFAISVYDEQGLESTLSNIVRREL